MQKIDHRSFIALLNAQFPEVVAQIDDCSEGLLHLEMATLARATQHAIDNQDRSTVMKHFKFIDEVFRDAAPEVENAVNVSYLENINFDRTVDAPKQARELLSPRMQKALIELEQYLDRLFHEGEMAKNKSKP